MLIRHPFTQVDVFSPEPYRGNPVAVIHDAESTEDETMQRIAQWTNLSETTFVLPPTSERADYRLRIFTPTGELPFAGHPTLGSARAWLENGGLPHTAGRIVQECKAGLVELRDDGDVLAFAAPPLIRTGQAPERYTVAQGARLDRAGQITISLEDETVWVGGAATALLSGVIVT